MIQKRYLEPFIQEDLTQKMVFLAGPRQVGKTTLAQEIAKSSPPSLYLSWDRREDRGQILNAQWPLEKTVIIFDELHKYGRWKRFIKGEYDKFKGHHRFIITGSARLDIYRKGGDSLQGRYHHFRLHPFTLKELLGEKPQIKIFQEISFGTPSDKNLLGALFQWSGFPEPILGQRERIHRRWQKERLERFFREDIRDLENVRDISSMQILTDLLPDRAANILSLNSLREDLEVSHRAISHWMDILERLYFVFRIRPFESRRTRGLKKQTKLYLWDWSLIANPAFRFENMVACHLLKLCHFLEDTEGYSAELFYLRDVDKREVDFLVTIGRKPWFAVEAKFSDTTPSPHLHYFGERLKIPFLYQVVREGIKEFVQDSLRVLPAEKFLSGLI